MQLNGQPLALSEIAAVALGDTVVEVSPSAHPRVLASRKVIENIIARDAVVYGVSTGFGKLSDVRISLGYPRATPSGKRPIVLMALPKCPGVSRTTNAPHGSESVRFVSSNETAGGRP